MTGHEVVALLRETLGFHRRPDLGVVHLLKPHDATAAVEIGNRLDVEHQHRFTKAHVDMLAQGVFMPCVFTQGIRRSRYSGHRDHRSEEHTSELQSLMRISYAVFCLKKKNNNNTLTTLTTQEN